MLMQEAQIPYLIDDDDAIMIIGVLKIQAHTSKLWRNHILNENVKSLETESLQRATGNYSKLAHNFAPYVSISKLIIVVLI